MTALAIVGSILGILAFIASGAGAFYKIISHLTRIEVSVEQTAKMAKEVPNLNYRVTTIERHLEISTPELPTYRLNGHGGSEDS